MTYTTLGSILLAAIYYTLSKKQKFRIIHFSGLTLIACAFANFVFAHIKMGHHAHHAYPEWIVLVLIATCIFTLLYLFATYKNPQIMGYACFLNVIWALVIYYEGPGLDFSPTGWLYFCIPLNVILGFYIIFNFKINKRM